MKTLMLVLALVLSLATGCSRGGGDTAEKVIRYTIPFVEGQRESGILTCVKHWPGDGTEERDQHLVLGVNELSPAEWEASFGEVYRAHIANGAEMVMAGHIALPAYQKQLDPSLDDADILPADLAVLRCAPARFPQAGRRAAFFCEWSPSRMRGPVLALRWSIIWCATVRC